MKAIIQGTIKKKVQDMESGDVFYDGAKCLYFMVTDEGEVVSLQSGVSWSSSSWEEKYSVYTLEEIHLKGKVEEDTE